MLPFVGRRRLPDDTSYEQCFQMLADNDVALQYVQALVDVA